LLQQGSAHANRVAAALNRVALHRALGDTALYGAVLPSQLVRFQAADSKVVTPPSTTTTTTAPPVAPAVTPPAVTPPAEAPAARQVSTPVTVRTAPATTATGDAEHGQATWYSAAPPGRCASPTLPFGTVLTVTNLATGASTTCTVDDREQAGYPRVVDLSPSGFAQLAEPSQGVVDVSISW
jgi:rare lipoprotein A (peptidoglycan hydrolase)